MAIRHILQWALLALFFFLVMAEGVSAVKPISQTSLNGLSIVYTKVEYLSAYQTDRFGFHVYNSTNYWMDNTSVTCNVHIIDNLGNHIEEDNATYEVNHGWYVVLPTTITNKPGTYGFIISCENGGEAGFIADQLDILEIGTRQFEVPEGISILLTGFLLFLIFVAGYFTIKKHPLSYLFLMFSFIFADTIVYVAMRLAQTNGALYFGLLKALYIGMLVITFIMFIVTLLDVTRLVIDFNRRKKTKEDIARFGYA